MIALKVREFKLGEDLAAHYRAVQERIQNVKAPAPRVSQTRTIYLSPRNKPEPKGRVVYAAPIGPIFIRDFLWVATKPGRGQGKKIMAEVASKYGIPLSDILSQRRTKNLVIPRQEILYRMRHETGLSYPQIGQLVGRRDHTTAMHGVRAYTKRLANGEVTL